MHQFQTLNHQIIQKYLLILQLIWADIVSKLYASAMKYSVRYMCFINFGSSTDSPSDVFQNDDANDFTKIWLYVVVSKPASEHGLNNSNVQKIIHSKELKFDLVVVQDMFSESWLMFAYKFDAPVISICKLFLKTHPTVCTLQQNNDIFRQFANCC